MGNYPMKCSLLIGVLATLVTLVGCAGGSGSSTSNIQATVEATSATAAPPATLTPTPPPTQIPIAILTPTTTPVPTPTSIPSLADILREKKSAVVLIKTGFGEGSGFVFDKDGWILTNNHVVGSSDTVDLVLGGRLTVTGRVVGRDDGLDVAVISVDFDGDLPIIAFGNSSLLEQGEDVAIIGYPLGSQLGESPSVTKGIVSARRILENFEFIQTDSPVNPGNSGGPLINAQGEVVGIITAKVERSEGRLIEGIGLAIPINTVRDVLPFLRAEASVGGTPTVQTTAIPTPAPVPTATLVPATPPPKGAYFDVEGNIVTPPWIPTSTPKPTLRPTPTPRPVGPLSGNLIHDPSSNSIKLSSAGTTVTNFVAEATFFNPFSLAEGSWDYGFMFRHSGSEFDFAAVTSQGMWEHRFRSSRDDDSGEQLGSGSLSGFFRSVAFDTTSRGSNHLRIVVVGNKGWLFVNGQYVSTLNFGTSAMAGKVEVATGLFAGNEVVERVTRFQNFSVTPLFKLGPLNGELQKEAGLIAKYYAGRHSGSSAVAEARFFNPSPLEENWSYGFLFGSIEHSEVFDAVFVRKTEGQFGGESSKWHHYTRTGSSESSIELDSGVISSMNTEVRGSNYLLMILLGDDGWFFVNDTFISKLNIEEFFSINTEAISGYFSTDQSTDVVTRFEEFTVWSP